MERIQLRQYQQQIADCIDKNRFAIALLPRRAGKTELSIELCLRQCFKEKSNVFLVVPSAIHAEVICTKIKLLRPNEIAKTTYEFGFNKINFKNGSCLYVFASYYYIGGDCDFYSMIPDGIVFDEFGLQEGEAYEIMSRKYKRNKIWWLIISSVKSKEQAPHLYKLYHSSLKKNPETVFKFTVDDTKHLDDTYMQELKDESSREWIRQDFYCEFPKDF